MRNSGQVVRALKAGGGRLLVDNDAALVSRKIFVDEDIYAQELKTIFRKCWLFVGHDSMLPNPGDFISNYMGEDPVIVWRKRDGSVGVYLNTCPHRGNKLCLYDRGNARTFSCSFHGWTFNADGKLTGIPFDKFAYEGDLDRDENSLVTAEVRNYGGLIFAAWEPQETLDEYLGEMRYWFDTVICHDDQGGLVYLPSVQKYKVPGNWKIVAENFSGDFYHVPTSHESGLRAAYDRKSTGRSTYVDSVLGDRPTGPFNFAVAPGHGVGSVTTDETFYEKDLVMAERLGPEAVEFVKERRAMLLARTKSVAKPEGWVAGNVFPNMCLMAGSGIQGQLLALIHPRGVQSSEQWQWQFIERDAPDAVKRFAASYRSQSQSASGVVGLDDGENFERIAEAAHGPMTADLTYNYELGMGRDRRREDFSGASRENWVVEGIPGEPSRCYFSETNQRQFYDFWAKRMNLEGATV